MGVLQLLLEVERGERVLCLDVQDAQLAEIQQLAEFLVAAEPDQVVEFARPGQRLDDGEQLLAILDLANLLRKQFGVVQRVANNACLIASMSARISSALLNRLAVVLHLVAEFGGEFVVVVPVDLIECGLDVGEIDDVAVAELVVAAIDPGQRLQQVVILDDRDRSRAS